MELTLPLTAPVPTRKRTAPPAPLESPSTLRGVASTFWRHGSPRILVALVATSAALRLALGDYGRGDAAVLLGLLLFWPVQEWLIHVFVLHWRPRTLFGRTVDPMLSRKHRAHHADPSRLDLLFIPNRVYLHAPLAIAAIWLAIAPSPRLAVTGIAGHFLLGLHYEWVHFLVHTRYVPKSSLYRRLWKNHRLHHYKNEQYWHGVTMLSADHLFRTSPDRDAVPTSPGCFALHEAP